MADTLTPETKSADDRSWARPLFEREIAMLGELAEAGLEVALAIKDQAMAAAQNGGNVAAFASAYARAARAVRMTILLQSKLIKQLQDWERDTLSRATDDQEGDRKARVERDHAEAEEVEWLVGDGAERLDRDDIYGLVQSRPVSELVAMICKDLGLDPDWPKLAEEAWARAEMAGGDVGWPMAGWTDRSPNSGMASGPNFHRSSA
jgi:hypothetical protein